MDCYEAASGGGLLSAKGESAKGESAGTCPPPCPESVDNYKVVVTLVGAIGLVFGEIDR
jgi:hypothetical protein